MKKYRDQIIYHYQQEKTFILKNFRKNFRILLVYPNTYYVGMSNLGFQTIYQILNNMPDVVCERTFLPDKNCKPLSYENLRYPEDFNLILFSVSFELDFFNIIKFLKLSEIPLFSAKRKNMPLIAAGGIAITLNYRPLSKILDYSLIGEGEDLIVDFINSLLRGDDPEKLEGVNTEKSKGKRVVYTGEKVCHTSIFTPYTEFADTMLIEIARGCPYKCNFCAASYNYSPYRIKKIGNILNILNNYSKFYKKVGIVGTSVTSHPDFLKICKWLNSREIKFSITSIRLNTVSYEILEELIKGGNKTFAVAIESGNETIRNKIGKNLSNKDIFNAIDKFIDVKILNLKFYFIIGFVGETLSDVNDIIELIKSIKEKYINKRHYLKQLGKFIISVNPFIPKPNTPFYNLKMEEEQLLNNKIKLLHNEIKKIPNSIFQYENLYSSYLQGLISKGDDTITEILIEKEEKGLKDKAFFKKYYKIFKKFIF